MKSTTSSSLMIAAFLLASNYALASGGGGFGQGGNQYKSVDQQYELGKSYYKGRLPDGSKLSYCIKSSNGLAKLSRKSVKPFKKGPAANFVNSLYNCNAPDQKIAELFDDAEGSAVLHYLNKRFKLRLTSGT